MDEDYTPQQWEKIFQLVDALGMENISVAAAMLIQYQWDLNKAIDELMFNRDETNKTQYLQEQNQAVAKKNEDQDVPEEDEYEYQYENAENTDLQKKKQMFEQQYVSFPLQKTVSLAPLSLQRRLSFDRTLLKQYPQHRKTYQEHLAKNIDQLINKIVKGSKMNKKQTQDSHRKIQNNKKFLRYLHDNYNSKINFTFGTFFINLVRSYLENKYLLVYIHSSNSIFHKVIQMILCQKQIAKFANENCVCYGMFDNSDDYETVHKYTPLTTLPAFALFKFNKKTQSESFLSSYAVMQKGEKNFLEWLATEIGLSIKQKQNSSKSINSGNKLPYVKISDLVNQQNQLYHQLQKTYIMKRQISKAQKQSIAAKKEDIQLQKKNFQAQPNLQPQKTIQIKFRTPFTGKSKIRNFIIDDQINKLFKYVHCFCRGQFENQFGNFDLIQSFPLISLREHLKQKIKDVFPGSDHQNIIVKEL